MLCFIDFFYLPYIYFKIRASEKDYTSSFWVGVYAKSDMSNNKKSIFTRNGNWIPVFSNFHWEKEENGKNNFVHTVFWRALRNILSHKMIINSFEIDELTCFYKYNDAKTKKKNLIKVNFSTSIVIWFLEVSSSQTNHLHSCSLFKCTSDIILNWSYKFRFMFIGRPFLNICFKESLFFNSILRIDKTLLVPLY
jgi:hypothetical protein